MKYWHTVYMKMLEFSELMMLNLISISIVGIITSMCSSITWASSALALISHIQISIQLAV